MQALQRELAHSAVTVLSIAEDLHNFFDITTDDLFEIDPFNYPEPERSLIQEYIRWTSIRTAQLRRYMELGGNLRDALMSSFTHSSHTHSDSE